MRSNSPVIEAGLNSDAPTNDMDYVSRPYDADGNGLSLVDMGAYEWSPWRAKILSLTFSNQQPVVTWTSMGGGHYRFQWGDEENLASSTTLFAQILRPPAQETDPGPDGMPSTMAFTDTISVSPTNPPRVRLYRIQTVSQP